MQVFFRRHIILSTWSNIPSRIEQYHRAPRHSAGICIAERFWEGIFAFLSKNFRLPYRNTWFNNYACKEPKKPEAKSVLPVHARPPSAAKGAFIWIFKCSKYFTKESEGKERSGDRKLLLQTDNATSDTVPVPWWNPVVYANDSSSRVGLFLFCFASHLLPHPTRLRRLNVAKSEIVW